MLQEGVRGLEKPLGAAIAEEKRAEGQSSPLSTFHPEKSALICHSFMHSRWIFLDKAFLLLIS